MQAHEKSTPKKPNPRKEKPPAAHSSGPVSKESIRHALHQLSLPIHYIDNLLFRSKTAKHLILGEGDRAESPPKLPKRPPNVSAYFAALYETPLLSAEEEATLFRRFNYLKFRAETLRRRITEKRPDASKVREIANYLRQAEKIWERLVQANLRLVVSIARRFVNEHNSLDDLISDGQIALMSAVRSFDYSRGFRFSTYATHAIQRAYYRRMKTSQRDAHRLRALSSGFLEEIPDRVNANDTSEEEFRLLQQTIRWISEELSDRERFILESRFGLDGGREQRTLRDIGEELGISKERVRQIQLHAIEKLKVLANPQPLLVD
jgi:RNA polymerase primary sigma factor